MAVIVAVVLAAAGAGIATARHWGFAGRLADLGLAASLWLILPIVTFFNVARFDFTGEVGAGIVFAYVGLAASLTLAYLLARGPLGLHDHTRGAFMCAAFLANTGFLGLPFTAALLGYDDLPAAISYDVLVSTPSLLLVAFSIGAYYRLEPESEQGVRAFLVRNPALYAAVAAVLAPDALAPGWAVDGSRVLVVAMAPIGFFSLGVYASGTGRGFRFPPSPTRPVVVASLLKLTVPLAVLALCAALVHDVPDAYYVQAAMPTALNSLLLVSAYRLDRGLIAGAIVYTTAITLTWGMLAATLT